MKLDKKKSYTIEDGTWIYKYIAHDSECIIFRNAEDGLIAQVPLTARIFEQIPDLDERLRNFATKLTLTTLPRKKAVAYLLDLLAKHHLKVIDLEVEPVKMAGQCSCIGCTNKATHTWSGHPTCDACK